MTKVTISKYDKIPMYGETHTIEEWLSILDSDLTIQAVTTRIRHGMTPQDALTLPRFLSKSDRTGDKGAARDFADYNRSYKQKEETEPHYEWKFVRVNASAGEFRKVLVE